MDSKSPGSPGSPGSYFDDLAADLGKSPEYKFKAREDAPGRVRQEGAANGHGSTGKQGSQHEAARAGEAERAGFPKDPDREHAALREVHRVLGLLNHTTLLPDYTDEDETESDDIADDGMFDLNDVFAGAESGLLNWEDGSGFLSKAEIERDRLILDLHNEVKRLMAEKADEAVAAKATVAKLEAENEALRAEAAASAQRRLALMEELEASEQKQQKANKDLARLLGALGTGTSQATDTGDSGLAALLREGEAELVEQMDALTRRRLEASRACEEALSEVKAMKKALRVQQVEFQGREDDLKEKLARAQDEIQLLVLSGQQISEERSSYVETEQSVREFAGYSVHMWGDEKNLRERAEQTVAELSERLELLQRDITDEQRVSQGLRVQLASREDSVKSMMAAFEEQLAALGQAQGVEAAQMAGAAAESLEVERLRAQANQWKVEKERLEKELQKLLFEHEQGELSWQKEKVELTEQLEASSGRLLQLEAQQQEHAGLNIHDDVLGEDFPLTEAQQRKLLVELQAHKEMLADAERYLAEVTNKIQAFDKYAAGDTEGAGRLLLQENEGLRAELAAAKDAAEASRHALEELEDKKAALEVERDGLVAEILSAHETEVGTAGSSILHVATSPTCKVGSPSLSAGDESETTMDALQEVAEKWKSAAEAKDAEKSALEQRLAESEEAMQSLLSELAQLRLVAELDSSRKLELEGEKKEAEELCGSLQEQLRNSQGLVTQAEAAASSTAAELAQERDRGAELASQKQTLEATLEEARDRKRQLASTLEQKQEEVERHVAKIEELCRDLEASQAEARALRAALEEVPSLNDALEAERERSAALSRDLEGRRVELEAAEQERDGARAALESSTAQSAEQFRTQSDALARLEEEKAVLEGELQAARVQEKESLQGLSAKLQEEAARWEQALASARDQNEQERKEAHARIAELEKEEASLRHEARKLAEEAKDEACQWAKEKEGLHVRTGELEKEVAGLQQELAELRQEREGLDKALARGEEEAKDRGSALEAAERELEALKQEGQRTQAMHEGEVQNLQSQVDALKGQVEGLLSSARDAEKKLAQAAEDLALKEEGHATLSEECAGLRSELEAARADLAAAVDQLQQERAELEGAKIDMNNARKQVMEITAQLEAAQRDLKVEHAERHRTAQELQEAQEQLLSRDQAYQELQQEKAKLEALLADAVGNVDSERAGKRQVELRLAQVEELLSATEEARAQLSSRAASLAEDLSAASQQLVQERQEREQLEESAKQTSEALSVKEKAVEEQGRAMELLEAEVQRCAARAEEEFQRVASLEAQLGKQSAEAVLAQEGLLRMEAELASAQEELKGREQLLEQESQKSAGLAEELARMQAALALAEDKCTEWRGMYESVQEELQSCQQQLVRVTGAEAHAKAALEAAQLEMLEAQRLAESTQVASNQLLQEAEAAKAELLGSVQSSGAELQAAKQGQEQLLAQLEAVETKLCVEMSKNGEEQERAKALAANVAALREKLAAARVHAEEQEQKLAQSAALLAEHEETRWQWQGRVQEAAEKVQSLERSLGGSERELSIAEERAAAAEQALERLRHEVQAKEQMVTAERERGRRVARELQEALHALSHARVSLQECDFRVLKASLAAAEAKSSGLTGQLAEARAAHQQLKEHTDTLQKELEDKHTAYTEQHGEAERLRTEKALLEERIGTLEGEREENASKIRSLEAAYQEHADEMAAQQETLRVLEEELRSEKDQGRVIAEAREEQEKVAATLRGELEALREQEQALRLQLEEEQGACATARLQNESLLGELADAQASALQVSREAEERVQELQQEVAQAAQVREGLMGQVAAAEVRQQELEESVRQLTQGKEELEESLRQVTQGKEELQEILRQLRQEKEERGRAVESLSAELAFLESALEEAVAEESKLQEQSQSAQAMLEARLREERAKWEAELQGKEALCAQLEARCRGLEDELGEAQVSLAAELSSAADLELQRVSLESDVQVLHLRVAELQAQLRQGHQDCATDGAEPQGSAPQSTRDATEASAQGHSMEKAWGADTGNRDVGLGAAHGVHEGSAQSLDGVPGEGGFAQEVERVKKILTDRLLDREETLLRERERAAKSAADLQAKLEQERGRCAMLIAQCASLEESLGAAQRGAAASEERLSQLLAEASQKEGALASSAQDAAATEAGLRSQLRASLEEAEEWKAQANELQKKLAAAVKKHQGEQKQVAREAGPAGQSGPVQGRLEEEVRAKSQEIVALSLQLRELSEAAETQRQEKASCDARAAQSEAQTKRLQEELASKEEEVKRAGEALKKAQQELAAARQLQQTSERRMRETLDQMRKEQASREAELAALRKREVQGAVAVAQEEIKTLSASAADKDKAWAAKERAWARAEAQRLAVEERLRREAAQARSEVARTEAEVKKREQELRSTVEAWRSKEQEWQRRERALSSELSKERRRLQRMQGLEAALEAIQKAEKALGSKLQAAEAVLARAPPAPAEATESAGLHQGVQENVARLEKLLAGVEHKAANLEALVEQKEEECAELRKEVKAITESIARARVGREVALRQLMTSIPLQADPSSGATEERDRASQQFAACEKELEALEARGQGLSEGGSSSETGAGAASPPHAAGTWALRDARNPGSSSQSEDAPEARGLDLVPSTEGPGMGLDQAAVARAHAPADLRMGAGPRDAGVQLHGAQGGPGAARGAMVYPRELRARPSNRARQRYLIDSVFVDNLRQERDDLLVELDEYKRRAGAFSMNLWLQAAVLQLSEDKEHLDAQILDLQRQVASYEQIN